MEKTKKTVLDKSSWLTTKKQRVKYYVSDLGRTCEGALVTTFMTMFLLMQGINPAKIAGIMLAVKIIDSFDDVIFGFLIDKLHLDKLSKLKKIVGEGKYLPWFRLTFWMFPIFTVIFFMMPQDISETAKLIWFGVSYLLYDLTYTLVEVPMNSLAVSITDNLEERNVIIQNRQILNSGIIMIIGAVFYALVSEMVGLPIKWVVFGSSIIFFAMMVPMTKPSAMEGSTRWRMEPVPETGSHCRLTEKTRMSMMLSQKFGVEKPMSAATVAMRSKMEYCLVAEMMPAGMPTISARRIAENVSCAV